MIIGWHACVFENVSELLFLNIVKSLNAVVGEISSRLRHCISFFLTRTTCLTAILLHIRYV